MHVPTEIINKIEKALSNKNLPKGLQIIRDNALQIKKEQVKELIKIMGIDKYKLVFIGAIGSGKTTAICHLFDLTNNVKITKSEGKGSKKQTKKVEAVKELMTVGAGGTTIAEVIVKITDNANSYFHVDFVSENELKELVDSFCDQTILKEEKEKSGRLMSQEEERAFRNILNLIPNPNNQNPENEILKRVNNNEDDFKNEILKSLENITKDTFREIHFVQEQELIADDTQKMFLEKKWISETFKKINVADYKDFSIPKKIEIYLSNNIIEDNNPLKMFHSIIDTKGLDAARDKKSIDDYLKEEDTICIFTTRYEVAPDERITHFINKHLQDDLKQTHLRFITLLLPRENEPEKVIGYDGDPINDWDEGVKYKKNVIQNTFNGLGINFSEKNILHYDAFRYFENEMPDKEYIEDIIQDKNLIVNRIQNIIAYRREMEDLLKKFEETVDTIIGGILSEDVIEKIQDAIEKLKAYRKLIVDIDFGSKFIDRFNTLFWHWATKHSINRNHGVIEWRDIDLKYISQELTKELVRQKTTEYKSRILEIINDLGSDDSSEIFKSIAEQLKYEFLSQYNNFITEIAKSLFNRLNNNEFNYNSNLWEKLIGEYGKGAGFVYRILNIYKDDLSNLQYLIKKNIEDNWEKEIIQKLLSFLGETELKKKTMIDRDIKTIKEIEIKNYFSIDEEGIKFENLQDKSEIYLVGDNGTGKTIILQAIARALKGEQNIGAINDVINQNYRKSPLFFAKDNNDYEYTNQERGSKSKSYDNLFAYGVNRLSIEGLERIDWKNGEVYLSIFNNRYNLIDPLVWLPFVKLESQDNPKKLLNINTIQNLINELLERKIKIDLKGSDVKFIENKTPTSFSQLSDGYKSSIVWLCDLLARLSYKQPYVTKLSDFKGLVMVDEINEYIHPTLQFSLVKKLRDKFKGIQWIFTTHSPILNLGASENAIVYKVYKELKEEINENGEVKKIGVTRISKPMNVVGHTANSLITSTIWNVPNFVTEGTELELISNMDNIYKNIHKVVSEKQKNNTSFDENDLIKLIENELDNNE